MDLESLIYKVPGGTQLKSVNSVDRVVNIQPGDILLHEHESVLKGRVASHAGIALHHYPYSTLIHEGFFTCIETIECLARCKKQFALLVDFDYIKTPPTRLSLKYQNIYEWIQVTLESVPDLNSSAHSFIELFINKEDATEILKYIRSLQLGVPISELTVQDLVEYLPYIFPLQIQGTPLDILHDVLLHDATVKQAVYKDILKYALLRQWTQETLLKVISHALNMNVTSMRQAKLLFGYTFFSSLLWNDNLSRDEEEDFYQRGILVARISNNELRSRFVTEVDDFATRQDKHFDKPFFGDPQRMCLFAVNQGLPTGCYADSSYDEEFISGISELEVESSDPYLCSIFAIQVYQKALYQVYRKQYNLSVPEALENIHKLLPLRSRRCSPSALMEFVVGQSKSSKQWEIGYVHCWAVLNIERVLTSLVPKTSNTNDQENIFWNEVSLSTRYIVNCIDEKFLAEDQQLNQEMVYTDIVILARKLLHGLGYVDLPTFIDSIFIYHSLNIHLPLLILEYFSPFVGNDKYGDTFTDLDDIPHFAQLLVRFAVNRIK